MYMLSAHEKTMLGIKWLGTITGMGLSRESCPDPRCKMYKCSPSHNPSQTKSRQGPDPAILQAQFTTERKHNILKKKKKHKMFVH